MNRLSNVVIDVSNVEDPHKLNLKFSDFLSNVDGEVTLFASCLPFVRRPNRPEDNKDSQSIAGEDLLDSLQDRLEILAVHIRTMTKAKIKIATCVGPLGESTTYFTDRHPCDLLIVVTEKDKPNQNKVVRNIFRETSFPVWLHQNSSAINSITVCLDPDDQSSSGNLANMQSLRKAVYFSEILSVPLHILAIWSPVTGTNIDQFEHPLEIDRYVKAAKEKTQYQVQRMLEQVDLSRIESKLHIKSGKPMEQIQSFLETSRSEIVILGHKNRQGMTGFFMGNTAEQVVGKINCDLVSVKYDCATAS